MDRVVNVRAKSLTWAIGCSSQTLSHRMFQYRTTFRSLTTIHSSPWEVKVWSSESDRISIYIIFMSPCGGNGVLMSYQSYRRARYRGTFYKTFRTVRHRYRFCNDTGTNPGTDVHTGTGGTGIDVVPNLPKCPVPVLMPYRTYGSVRRSYQTHRSVRYRQYRRYAPPVCLGTYPTEHTPDIIGRFLHYDGVATLLI